MVATNLTEAVAVAMNGAVAVVAGALAILLLAANPRRSWNQWLCFFLALIAGNFAAGTGIHLAAVLRDAGLLERGAAALWEARLRSLGTLFLIFDPAVLAYFASIFPRRTGLANRPWAVGLLGAVVVALATVEVFTRHLSAQAPGSDLLRAAPFASMAACYLYAAHRLVLSYREEPSSVMSDQARIVTLGVLVAVIPRLALLPADPPVGALLGTVGDGALARAAELGVRVALLAALFAFFASALARDPDPARRPRTLAMVRAVGAVFLLFALVWATFRLPFILEARGEWAGLAAVAAAAEPGFVFTIRWFVFAGAVVWGILRYELLAVLMPSLGLAGVGGGALAVAVTIGLTSAALGPWAGAAVGGVLMAAGSATLYLALADRRRGVGGAYLHQRAIEAYRALLAKELATGNERAAGLADARRRLGVTAREHETLLAIAQTEEALGGARQPRLLLGTYEVLRDLAAGGYATVHLARDHGHGRIVVLKRIRTDRAGERGARASSLRELAVARRVSHPNIVAIHDVVPVDDGAVVVMEYAEGGSLRDLLQRAGAQDPRRAADLLREALAGLAAVHEAGVVHGDLKPENLLLTAEGRVKLADFGLARAHASRRTLADARAGGGGTPAYMAPELLRGGPPSVASDVFALGRVAEELLAGGLPGDTEATAGKPPGPLPPAWAAFVARACAPEPGDRFPSAEAMARALPGSPEGPGRAGSAASRLPPSSSSRLGV